MPGSFSLDPFSDPEKAGEHLAKGKDLNTKGQFDAALTEFRRTVLANPKLFEAWMEIGALCKTKAKSDKMFLRYSFEAYQKASRLAPSKQEAHDQYIMVSQMMGQLEEINEEYRQLSKKFPDDALIQRCFKNTSTLLMAMIPEKVDFTQTEHSKKIKAALFAVSLALLFLGMGSTILPIVLVKGFKVKLTAALMSQIMKAGIGMIVCGVAGVIIKARMS